MTRPAYGGQLGWSVLHVNGKTICRVCGHLIRVCECPASARPGAGHDGGRVISHDAPAITLAQPHENSIHQHIKSDSFVHGGHA
jgi:hypothetical protein